MKYSQYLNTPHWKEIREKKLSQVSYCQICESTKHLNIHHKHYFIGEGSAFAKHQDREVGSILFHEELSDLMVLCASCHTLWHKNFGRVYFRHKKASKIRRLIKLGCQKELAFKLSKEKGAYSVILDALQKAAGVKINQNPGRRNLFTDEQFQIIIGKEEKQKATSEKVA